MNKQMMLSSTSRHKHAGGIFKDLLSETSNGDFFTILFTQIPLYSNLRNISCCLPHNQNLYKICL